MEGIVEGWERDITKSDILLGDEMVADELRTLADAPLFRKEAY